MAQIQALLQGVRGAGRVQRLEREKEMQAEQLRMMEERMIEQELTEEELAVLEDELDPAKRIRGAGGEQGGSGARARMAAGAEGGVEPTSARGGGR